MTDLTTLATTNTKLSSVDGRESVVAFVSDWIESSGSIIGIEGIGGSGKSHFLKAIGIECEGAFDCHHVEIDIGLIQNTTQFVSRLVGELKEARPTVDAENILETIESVNVDRVKKCVFALVRDCVAKAKESLPNLVNEIEGAAEGFGSSEFSSSSMEELASDNQLYLVTEYLRVLGEMGVRAIITIDGVELAEPEVARAIDLIFRQAPEGWKIALASNVEVTEESPWSESLRSKLKAAGGVVLTLPDLSDEDLASWYFRATGEHPTEETLAKLTELSERRAKRVFELMKNPEHLDAGSVFSDYSDIQSQRRGNLTENAKRIGNILSRATPDKNISLDLLEQIYDIGGASGFSDAISELDNLGFISSSRDGVRIVHSSTHEEWRQSLSTRESDRVDECIRTVLDLSSDSILIDPQNRGVIKFAADRAISSGSAAEVYSLGKNLIEAGETSTGLILLEAGGAGGEHMNAASSDYVDQALLIASTKLALGKYSEAVQALVTAETVEHKDESQTLKTNLVRLKHCLRTNQYETLFAVSSTIKNNFSDNRDAQLERALIENTAARDLLDYDKIEETVLEIQRFDELDLSDDLRCSLSRSLARSFAKLGNLNKAKEHSARALELSQKLDHVRALGNSLFAEGEVLRYDLDNDGAIEFYDRAIKLAQGTNNRDAWLWALLAKGFAHLGQSQTAKAEQVHEKLEELLNEEGFNHPLEQLHSKLLALLAKKEVEQIEVDELVSKYSELGLAWPKEAIPRLLKDGITAAVQI